MIQRTLLINLIILCPLNLTWANDWPQWRGPERTGVSKETGLLQSWPAGGPKLLWTFRDAGIGFSSMSVVGHRLYSMGGDGKKEYVYAIDLKTQKKLWSTAVGTFYTKSYGNGPRSTPTTDGNFLYAIGGYGDLVCIEIASGKKVWSQKLQTGLGGTPANWGYSESPLVDSDRVIATPGGNKGAIAAFDKKTGVLKWRSTTCTYHATYSSMIAIEVAGVRQYVQNLRKPIKPNSPEPSVVVGVRASDGKLLWEFTAMGMGGAIAAPIYCNGCVYVSDLQGCKLVKLSSEGNHIKPAPVYANKELCNYHGGVILVDQYLYGYSDEASGWVCQDFNTGKTLQNKIFSDNMDEDDNMGRGSVTYADGNLYCYHENKGDVLLLKVTPTGYEEQGRFRIPEKTKINRNGGQIWSHPVVANGKLYLRDQDLIFCYDLRKSR